MENRILPLGSIVKLVGEDEILSMIVCRGNVVEKGGKAVYLDYGSVIIPQGMSSPESVYFFNKENIEEVIFKGYENIEEQDFADEYDKIIKSANVPKGDPFSD